MAITIKKQITKSQKNDFLMADYSCVHGEKYEKNKKDRYCKTCIHALILKNGIICPFGLNDKW